VYAVSISNNDDAFGAIYSRLSNQLHRFIAGRVSDAADVDDILQDVFLKIHAKLETLEDETRLESWVYQITRNAIVDFYRSKKPFSPIGDREDLPDSVDEEAPGSRLASGLREMVDHLPEPYREAILLVEFEGISQKELASRLGLSLSGAKSRVQRGRAHLRDMLNRCCHFEFDRFGAVIDYHPVSCCCCHRSKQS